MQLLKTKQEVREAVRAARYRGLSIGFVPTMGYLHEGHLSLARRARAENEVVVVSIYVNPTQFGPNEDLARYPRDLERDLDLCREVGVDIVWNPDEMYEPGHRTWVVVGDLTERLCGASRPTHFRGVTTVVTKLFGVVQPDHAYFGQKDAQQAFVIRRMTRDLDLGVDIVVCPTVREADGLAMSSRNVYLTPEQRAQAPTLRRALLAAEDMVAWRAPRGRDPWRVWKRYWQRRHWGVMTTWRSLTPTCSRVEAVEGSLCWRWPCSSAPPASSITRCYARMLRWWVYRPALTCPPAAACR